MFERNRLATLISHIISPPTGLNSLQIKYPDKQVSAFNQSVLEGLYKWVVYRTGSRLSCIEVISLKTNSTLFFYYIFGWLT